VSVLALVPARSGSRSVPDKNVLSFRGKPLLVHSIEHGLRAGNVDRVLVSTDSPRYRAIALAAGAEAPFLRPAEIAGDHATDLEVFEHALDWLERHEGYRPELCVHLRPTYPTRTVADVVNAVALLRADPRADAVRSVTLAPHTPYKMWRLAPDHTLTPLLECPLPEAYNMPRQALPEVYLQNAAVDVVRTEVIRRQRSMSGRRILAYVMDGCQDIDSWADLAVAEQQLPGDGPPRGCTFAFDLDGVLATLVPGNNYREAVPCLPAIDLLNRLYEAGNRIVIYTARGSLSGIDWTEATQDQLQRWGVRHHELRFGKPAADYYVDDRLISLPVLQAWVDSRGRSDRSRSA
jgi:CMP-N-acetylneuraminic acid synthetase